MVRFGIRRISVPPAPPHHARALQSLPLLLLVFAGRIVDPLVAAPPLACPRGRSLELKNAQFPLSQTAAVGSLSCPAWFVVALRRALHGIPELAFSEFKTAETIRRELKAIDGVEVLDCTVGGTGVVAVIKGKSAQCLACLKPLGLL